MRFEDTGSVDVSIVDLGLTPKYLELFKKSE